MDNENLDIRTFSTQICKKWWILVLVGSIGALVGFLLNILFITPLYLATSTISVSINFSQVGHLTQYEQDQFFGHILTFLRSDQIIDETLSSFDPTSIDKNQFLHNCFLERQLNKINFRCILAIPSEAQSLSIHWKEVGFQHLKNALNHAETYQLLLAKQSQFENCVQQAAQGLNSSFNCEYLRSEGQDVLDQLENEKQLSQGMLPGFSLLNGENASLPHDATRHQMNFMVFAGALIGLVISLFVISIKNVY